MALYGAETGTLRTVDQKQLESFEMWCWRRMEKISWTDHVRNEKVLLRVNYMYIYIHTLILHIHIYICKFHIYIHIYVNFTYIQIYT